MKFEKVWHKGLVCKLKSHGISGNLLKLIENYLIDRKQRVVLNDKTSSWKRVLSGIPRGSVLEPLLLLIYINDVPNVFNLSAKYLRITRPGFQNVKILKNVYEN